jgi:predicted nuclease with TOPRIM domain
VDIEGSFAFPTRQMQGMHKDLLAFEARTEERFNAVSDRFDGVDSKVDVLDRKFDGLDRKVDALDRKIDAKVDGLAKALPWIIGDAMREVLRAQSK